jgi:hypothetical protein
MEHFLAKLTKAKPDVNGASLQGVIPLKDTAATQDGDG